MGHDCGELVKAPTKGINGKQGFQPCNFIVITSNHDCYIEHQKDAELERLQYTPCPGHSETILIEQRRVARIVDGNWLLLVAIWDDLPVRGRCVDDAPLVDSVDDLLTRRGAQKMLALGQDGHLERRERALVCPGRLAFGLIPDILRRVLKGLKASNQNVSQEK